MRFYLDENLPPSVAEMARAQGLDVISSHECGRNGLPDDEQLRLAAEEQRCFVTRNRDDLIHQTERFAANGWPHGGLLIVTRSLPNHDPSRIAQALLSYSSAHEGDTLSYMINFLSAT